MTPQEKQDLKQFIAFALTLMALAIMLMLFTSCKKKKIEYKVHYEAYAKIVPYTVSYSGNQSLINERVETNYFSKDIIVNTKDVYSISIANIKLDPNDSVSISVTSGSLNDNCHAKLNNTTSNCTATINL